MNYLGLALKRLRVAPHALALAAKDVHHYYKMHENKHFHLFGLHIYLGKFGQGKTCSMVRDAWLLANKYEDVTILTNLHLTNFPENVRILELRCIQDILDAPDNTIVLIDEIGTIFNSRDWNNNQRKGKGKNEEGLPKILFQYICQVRHRNMVVFGTVQRWGFLDKQLRQITKDVTVCSAFPDHPFSRMITNYVYDGEEYDMFYQSPMRPLEPLAVDVWVQTDFIRSLYDTREMVKTLLSMDYIPDEEIDRNTSFEPVSVGSAPMDKKSEKRFRQNLQNR